jgi:hypothetical protein
MSKIIQVAVSQQDYLEMKRKVTLEEIRAGLKFLDQSSTLPKTLNEFLEGSWPTHIYLDKSWIEFQLTSAQERSKVAGVISMRFGHPQSFSLSKEYSQTQFASILYDSGIPLRGNLYENWLLSGCPRSFEDLTKRNIKLMFLSGSKRNKKLEKKYRSSSKTRSV